MSQMGEGMSGKRDIMEDVTGGRINTANITEAEWKLLETANDLSWWFNPSDDEWLACRGVLALIDVRRGYKVDPPLGAITGGEVAIQFGEAQIKINEHGILALLHRNAGQVYQHGEPMTQEAIDTLLEADGLID